MHSLLRIVAFGSVMLALGACVRSPGVTDLTTIVVTNERELFDIALHLDAAVNAASLEALAQAHLAAEVGP